MSKDQVTSCFPLYTPPVINSTLSNEQSFSEEDNDFLSEQLKSENIFAESEKEQNESQFSSKILGFPFTLESYKLIHLKNKNESILNSNNSIIILGEIDFLRFNDYFLELIFCSKDKIAPLDLKNHINELKTLQNNSDIIFIMISKNQLILQFENDLITNEIYSSLQTSFSLFNLLYDEEHSINSGEESNSGKKSKINIQTNNNCNKFDISINNQQNDQKININISNKEQSKIQRQNKIPQTPIILPPTIFSPIILNLNNFNKDQTQQFNPSLLIPLTQTTNPLLIQTALAMQDILKMQQNKININKNINNKINNNNKESSTNSNTSAGSSKDSSPGCNYPNKNLNNNSNNNNLSENILNNNNISTVLPLNPNIKNSTNLNLKMDLMNNNNPYISEIFNPNIQNMYNNNFNNSNLEDIVKNKKYKEYVPKNKEKSKENNNNNSVEFHTNSTRDYQFKYVSRYIVQIENEKNFPVTKMIIGNNGMLLRKILIDNCINYGDHTTKIRLRGRGSGYKEGPKNEESKDPMELCISSLNILSFTRCSYAVESLLLKIYYDYYMYQCKLYADKKNESNNYPPITPKKILKYQYTVNRYNTLVKEEKRRKKEEEENNNNFLHANDKISINNNK